MLGRDVSGEDDHGDAALCYGGSHCDGKNPLQLPWFRDHSAIVTAILEQLFRMCLLKVIGSKLCTWNLSSDCKNWNSATMAVEKPIDQMEVSGTTTAGAYGQLSADVRFGASGKRRCFFITNVHPLNSGSCPNRVRDAIEGIAWQAPDASHTICDKLIHKNL